MLTQVSPDSLHVAAVRSIAFVVGVVCFAACGGAAGEGGGSESAGDTTFRANGGLAGNPAPDFSVKAVGSKETLSLKKLHGQVVIVDFWGTFCEPCKKSFPKLQALSRKYSDQGLQVVGISEDEAEDKDKIPSFAQAFGASFVLAWDEDKSIARAYKPETMPSSFIIDRKGIVRFVHVGYHDGEDVQIDKEVKELLAR